MSGAASVGGPGTIIFNGAIGDGGDNFGLTKIGAGTVMLTAVNTYTGGTTASAVGPLQIGANNGTTGNFIGNVTDNANFAFSRSGRGHLWRRDFRHGQFDPGGHGHADFDRGEPLLRRDRGQFGHAIHRPGMQQDTTSFAGGLTFNGSGTFNYNFPVAGGTQSMGALITGAGDGTVQSTYGSSGNAVLSFTALTRNLGGTINFAPVGGANGSTNKIVLSRRMRD